MATPLYLLSGPTASGKTGFAHRLADRMGCRLLSVDSMMVYRGMDIGTAKPTEDEQQQYAYAGLNLVDAGKPFSTGAWLQQVRAQLDDRPTLAVGGTGLYFQALVYGLDEAPAEEVRSPADVNALRDEIQRLDPQALSQLADPSNPRRLERAVEFLRAGKSLPESWAQKQKLRLPVLRRPTEELNARIAERVEQMFEGGLLEECCRLMDAGCLTGTAAQAIGYREVKAVLDGSLSVSEAKERICTRTRQYAKRQRTWFRNRFAACWIDLDADTAEDTVLAEIERAWKQTGPLFAV